MVDLTAFLDSSTGGRVIPSPVCWHKVSSFSRYDLWKYLFQIVDYILYVSDCDTILFDFFHKSNNVHQNTRDCLLGLGFLLICDYHAIMGLKIVLTGNCIFVKR